MTTEPVISIERRAFMVIVSVDGGGVCTSRIYASPFLSSFEDYYERVMIPKYYKRGQKWAEKVIENHKLNKQWK